MDEASIANKTKFDCDKCDYQATLKRNLKEHTESKHQSWTTLEV